MKEAVIFLDIQNDFCKEGFYYDKSGKNIGPLKKALKKINSFIKSDFMKNRFHILIKSEYQINQFGKNKKICVKGSKGAELSLDFPFNKIFTKHTHSIFSNKRILTYLKNFNIKKIYFVGFTSEFCIFQSANDALKLGFEVVILKDLSATNSERKKYETCSFKLLELYGANIEKFEVN